MEELIKEGDDVEETIHDQLMDIRSNARSTAKDAS